MKPNWKDAPEWARWLSQDYTGDWYWWETEPVWGESMWCFVSGNVNLAGYSRLPPGYIEERSDET